MFHDDLVAALADRAEVRRAETRPGEDVDALEAVLARVLSAAERELLRSYEEPSADACERRHGASRGALRMRVHRLRRRVAIELERAGLGEHLPRRVRREIRRRASP